MALEWVVLGYAAAAEAVMILLLTLPGLHALRKGLISVTTSLLKPFLSVVPFCLFLLMDIYWKYETRPSCASTDCSPSDHLRHQKSVMKSQRNALLIAAALVFYWILYSLTKLVVRVEQLNQRIENLKNKEYGCKNPLRRSAHSLKVKDALWAPKTACSNSTRSVPQLGTGSDVGGTKQHEGVRVSQPVDQEVLDTIEVGQALGFDLKGYEDQVRSLIVGEGDKNL